MNGFLEVTLALAFVVGIPGLVAGGTWLYLDRKIKQQEAKNS